MVHVLLLLRILIFPKETSGQCMDGTARLVILSSPGSNSRSDPNAGRFEICLGNQYGTIQMDSSTTFWSEKNALVACRQLGFEGALNSIPSAQLSSLNYATSTVPVHYSSVTCLGTESSISLCSSQPASTSSHNTDVFVVCWPSGNIYTDLHSNASAATSTVGSIRLVGESSNGAGVVEILTGIGWSTICPDSTWTANIASDICQILGYENGSAKTLSLSSYLVSPRLVQDPQCSSMTQQAPITRLDGGFCTFLESTSSACNAPDENFAAVTCVSKEQTGSTRLFGLDTIDNTRLQGAVEYFADGRWGVVCRPSSTAEVDESICEGFGHNRDKSSLISLSVSRIQMLESRMKPLWISDLQCDANDNSFSQCTIARPLGYGTCGISRDILIVDCGPKSRPFNATFIAAIVIPMLVVVIFIVVVMKKRVKLKKSLKRHPRLVKWLSCKCWTSQITISAAHQDTEALPSPIPAPIHPAAAPSPFISAENKTLTKVVPSNTDPEIVRPPPPSYNTSLNLPVPQTNLPPPYSLAIPSDFPSAPPPGDTLFPQENSTVLFVNPAFSPANSELSPATGASTFPPLNSDLIYPTGSIAP